MVSPCEGCDAILKKHAARPAFFLGRSVCDGHPVVRCGAYACGVVGHPSIALVTRGSLGLGTRPLVARMAFVVLVVLNQSCTVPFSFSSDQIGEKSFGTLCLYLEGLKGAGRQASKNRSVSSMILSAVVHEHTTAT